MEFVDVILDKDEGLGVRGEKEAVEWFVKMYNDKDFWNDLDVEGTIGYLENIKWDSLICDLYIGSCDGDIYYFLPFTPKYKARWGSPLIRFSKDMEMFAPNKSRFANKINEEQELF